ncbi:hypothetical protein ACH4E7_40720 [Kitasatospora sp. NPDC018058]|uniref:hypothetical protein n=1 Tax=Kitasatospora sp. NPDC018058 TaxID=3364025 RepID=UPI0037BE9FCA
MTADQVDGFEEGRPRRLGRWQRLGVAALAIGVLAGAWPAWQEWRPNSFAAVPASSCHGTLDEQTLRALMVDNEDVVMKQGRPLETAHTTDWPRVLGGCAGQQGEHQLVSALVNQEGGYPEPPATGLPTPKQRPSLLLQSVFHTRYLDHGRYFTSEGTRVFFRCWTQPYEADHYSIPYFMDVAVLGRAAGYGSDQGRLPPHQRQLLADSALKLAKVVSTELHCDAGIQLPAEPPVDSYKPATTDWLAPAE